jgi:moderate conductance mechanosensitive channel
MPQSAGSVPTTTLPRSGATKSTDGFIHQVMIGLGADNATANSVQHWLFVPLHIVVIVGIALLASLFIKRLAVRIVGGLRLVSPLVRATPRGQERARTLTGVVAGALRAVIWVIAGLLILDQLNISLTPFIATAAIIGGALGFGAQTLVRDFLSGMLIIAEDQYGVGDHVILGPSGTTTGTVESVSLRVTRIRGLDGVVWYVPNGDIRTVGNDTTNDSQALVDVVVPPGTDLTAAGAAAQSAADTMASEPQWREILVGPPVFAGVQAVDPTGVTIRLTAWTKPGRHFEVAREMRFRVLERLRADGLAWTLGDDESLDGDAQREAQDTAGGAESSAARESAARESAAGESAAGDDAGQA